MDIAEAIKETRNKLGLSQIQFSVLVGVPVSTLRSLEQGRKGKKRPANPALVIILKLIKSSPDVVEKLIYIASEKEYEDIREARALMKLISKSFPNKLAASILELIVHRKNPHFKLLRTIKVTPGKIHIE